MIALHHLIPSKIDVTAAQKIEIDVNLLHFDRLDKLSLISLQICNVTLLNKFGCPLR